MKILVENKPKVCGDCVFFHHKQQKPLKSVSACILLNIETSQDTNACNGLCPLKDVRELKISGGTNV